MPKIKAFFQKYETKIILILGFFLIAGLSFQAGFLKGQKSPQNPLIIEVPGNCPEFSQKAPEEQKKSPGETTTSKKDSSQNQECMFVGSKNSNKYHLPTCRFAKNIKSENLVCFSSIQEAEEKGYQPDKTCLK